MQISPTLNGMNSKSRRQILLTGIALLLLSSIFAPGAAKAFVYIPTITDVSSKLVTINEVTNWLDAQHPHLVVLEVSKSGEFAKGHLPQSQHIWRSDYQAKGYPYRGICPTREEMETLLGHLGVETNDTIVLYDECGNVNAARVWWMLSRYGHPNICIMDGGKHGWAAAGFQLDSSLTKPIPTHYTFTGTPHEEMYASKEMVEKALHDSTILILDVRTTSEYSGEEVKNGAMRGGHIPGSIFLNYNNAVIYKNDLALGLKSLNELVALYKAKGITPNKSIIVYCHTGMRSAHTTFVLKEILHFPDVKNYDGSWVEWSYFPELPLELGASTETPIASAETEANVIASPTPNKSYWTIIKESYRNYWSYLVSEVSMSYDYKPKWQNFFYALILLSLFFYGMELFAPWRKNQNMIRKDFWLDAFYMFFNVFLFGLIFYFALENVLVEGFNDLLGMIGIKNLLALKVYTLPVWAYYIILFLVADFIQWNVHRLLHRVPWLWEFHKLHHSVEEMGFAAHLRFHWMETLVYKGIQAIPLTMLGYNLADLFVLHIFNLAWGHFNHANITVSGRTSGGILGGMIGLGLGLLYTDGGLVVVGCVAGAMAFGAFALGSVMKYLFNSPEMHIWHHAHDLPEERKYGVNFGLSLAIWDYLFGTAYIPHDGRDIKLGFDELETYPKSFLGQITSGFLKAKK